MGEHGVTGCGVRAPFVAGLCWLLVLWTLAACGQSGPTQPGCQIKLDGVCWGHLGLDGESGTALAQTPWGLYAGTDRSGLFRLQPSSWRWVKLGLDHAVISSIVVVPGSSDRLLVGVEPYADEQTEAAVFASEDGGESWLLSDGGLAARNDNRFWAFSLAVSPSEPRRVFMGGSAQVLRSDDGGRTWRFVSGDEDSWGPGIDGVVISPDADGRVWAGGTSAVHLGFVLYSADWGETWEQSWLRPNVEIPLVSLMLDPQEEDRIWAGVGGGVMRSDDAGRTWEWSLVLGSYTWTFGLASVGSRIFATVYGARWPDPGTRLGLYVTEDGGASWDTLPVPSGVEGGLSLLAEEDGDLLVGTAGSGIWRVRP